MMLSPVPVPAAEPGGSSSQTWCCAGAWGVREETAGWEEQSHHLQISRLQPPLYSVRPAGGWEEHMHGKYKLCRKKKIPI